MHSPPLVVLLTDFGTEDAFAGILKGVIAHIAPGIPVLDLSHEIPPGDIQRAAILLWQSQPYYPPGTIFLCVVDPGVGTLRRGIIVNCTNQYFVGPDNGIFTYVIQEGFQVWEVANPDLALQDPSHTFHGRDIFAPAAAYLSLGRSPNEFGSVIKEPVRLPRPHLEFLPPNAIQGEILTVDRFGNLLTSLGKFMRRDAGQFEFHPWLKSLAVWEISAGKSNRLQFVPRESSLIIPGGVELSWATNFAEIPQDSCAFLLGSTGLLEIAANRRSAAEILDLHPGEKVTLRIRGESNG